MNWESLKQVYDDHHEQVLHVSFDILQDYGLAEDICAEVFVEFYEMENLAEWRVKGWLLERARKKAVRSLKKFSKKREQGLIVEYKVERKDKRWGSNGKER